MDGKDTAGLAPASDFGDATEPRFEFSGLTILFGLLLSDIGLGGGGGRTDPEKGGGFKAGASTRASRALGRFDISRLKGTGGGFKDFVICSAFGGGGLGLAIGFFD